VTDAGRLRVHPGAKAIAWIVVVELMAMGPVYRVEAIVGVHPSVVK
jgi:hypothetical protein